MATSRQPAKSLRQQQRSKATTEDPNASPTPEEDPNNDNVTPDEDPNNPANDDADQTDDSDDDSGEDEEVHQYAQHTRMLEDVDEDNDGIPDWLQVDTAPTDGIILAPDDDLRVEGEPTPDDTGVVLSKNVYRAFKPMGSKTWGFILEYPVGHVIAKSLVQPVQK